MALTVETIEKLNITDVLRSLDEKRKAEAALAAQSKALGVSEKQLSATWREQAKDADKAASASAANAATMQRAFGAGLLGGITAAVAGLDALSERVDAISDAAARSNLKGSTVEALGEAAREGGSDLKAIEPVLGQFVRRVGDAAKGSGETAEAFKRLGVSAVDAKGNLRATDDVFRDAVKSIAALEDPTQRATAAVQVFGRGAGPLLETGILDSTTALDDMIGKVEQFGISSAPNAAAAANEWQSAMADLKLVLDGTGASLLSTVGPTATDALKNFTLGLVAVKELGITPLNVAMNVAVTSAKALFVGLEAQSEAIRGRPLDAIRHFTEGLNEVGEQYEKNSEQIEADAKAGMERVKAFWEESNAVDADSEATGRNTQYRIDNAEAAAAQAKADQEAAEAAKRNAEAKQRAAAVAREHAQALKAESAAQNNLLATLISINQVSGGKKDTETAAYESTAKIQMRLLNERVEAARHAAFEGTKTEEEYQAQLIEIDQMAADERADIDAELMQARKEGVLDDVAAHYKAEQKKLNLEKAAAAQSKAIAADRRQALLSSLDGLASSAADAFGEESKVAKAAAQVQIAIAAVEGYAKALTLGPVAGAAYAAVVTAGIAIAEAKLAGIGTADIAVDDTPGVIRAPSNRRSTVNVKENDFVAAAQDPRELKRQVDSMAGNGSSAGGSTTIRFTVNGQTAQKITAHAGRTRRGAPYGAPVAGHRRTRY